MIGDIHQGGLRMIDIDSYIHAVKAKWMIRVDEASRTSAWAFIPACYMNKVHIFKVLNKLSEPDISKYKEFQAIPSFYKQAIAGYIHGNNSLSCDTKDIYDTCLWGNSEIKIKNNEILYFPNWTESGLLTVNDIKIVQGKIDESFIRARLIRKSNYISEMYQIKNALRLDANENLDTNPIDGHSKESIKICSSSAKQHYWKIINKKIINPKSCLYFNKSMELEDYNYSITYLYKVRNIPDKKICEFHFKLLSNILPCRQNSINGICVQHRLDYYVEK